MWRKERPEESSEQEGRGEARKGGKNFSYFHSLRVPPLVRAGATAVSVRAHLVPSAAISSSIGNV